MEIECKAARPKRGEGSVSFSDRCRLISFTADTPEQQELLGKLAAIVCGPLARRREFWKSVRQATETVQP